MNLTKFRAWYKPDFETEDGDCMNYFTDMTIRDFKVIGNIYKNKELLKKMKTSKIGYKIQQDDDGHYYLIESDQVNNFVKWMQYIEEGKFDGAKEFNHFNQCRIESPYSLIIYSCEEVE